MDKIFFENCAEASVTGSKKFPEIVMSLIKAGVENYHVDLMRSENRYYLPTGESIVVENKVPKSKIAENFSAELVLKAIRSSQAGQINYLQFMQQASDAGVVYYITSLKGKRVIYFGRNGDSHTEHFPK